MKLSRKCEYAILFLIELARQGADGNPMPTALIAEKNNIPRKFLDQIANMLKKHEYVASIRGQAGGYRLARRAGEVNLAEIIRMIDGPIAPISSVSEYFYAHSPSEQNEKLLACFKDIRDYTAHRLEQLTLDQLI